MVLVVIRIGGQAVSAVSAVSGLPFSGAHIREQLSLVTLWSATLDQKILEAALKSLGSEKCEQLMLVIELFDQTYRDNMG